MSTRSVIVVTGKGTHGDHRSIRLYKHSDGYPSGNLPIIAEALTKAKEQCDAENDRPPSDRKRAPNVDQVVGLLIGAATDIYGMSARIDDDGEKLAIYSETFLPKHLGNQFDLEWVYLVDLERGAVKVYGGGFSGKSPQHAYKRGMVDPRRYAAQLKTEYQMQELEQIESAIQAIKAAGFKVNPGKKGGRRKVLVDSSSGAFACAVVPMKAAA